MNILKISLGSNAIFSFVSGLLLIVLHQSIAGWFEIENTAVFWIIGIGLIYFSATILWQLRTPKTKGILFIIIQDLIWVVGSIIILLTNPFDISELGNQLITIVGFIVFFLSIGQSIGLSQMKNNAL